MIPLVTAAEAREIDARLAESRGLSVDALMESAARGMFDALRELWSETMGPGGRPIVALCGTGNNAGDALAVARMAAAAGCLETAAVVPPGLGAVAERRAREARLAGVSILAHDDVQVPALVGRAGLVLDGICGVGLRGELRRPLDALARLAAQASGPVVAIDVPSGVRAWEGGDSHPCALVRADCTLCVSPAKSELWYPGFREACGRIVPIGGVVPECLPAHPTSHLLGESDLPGLLPALPADAHKGTRGALGIYGGSYSGMGAARLAARSASASGAGTVSLMVRDELWPVAASSLDAQIVRRLSDGPGRDFDAALAGPGWGRDAGTAAALDELWAGELPLVLDADALRMLGDKPPRSSGAPLVLTPHPGEFMPLALVAAGASPGDQDAERLVADRTRFDTGAILLEAARRFDAVVILKNSVTWIASPSGSLAAWDGREPTLATGGSGDVLAGLLAGLMARGACAWDAARAAVIAHGMAGREAAGAFGFYDASALIPPIARIVYRGGSHGNQ